MQALVRVVFVTAGIQIVQTLPHKCPRLRQLTLPRFQQRHGLAHGVIVRGESSVAHALLDKSLLLRREMDFHTTTVSVTDGYVNNAKNVSGWGSSNPDAGPGQSRRDSASGPSAGFRGP